MRAFLYLSLVVVLLVCATAAAPFSFARALRYFSALMDPPLTTIEVRQILEKCSCEPEIQSEVDSVLSRYDERRHFYDWDLSTTPALARLSKTLGVLAMWQILPEGNLEIGTPRYLRVRFGQHFHYQFIFFFRTGTDTSLLVSPKYEHVTGNIYFDPTGIQVKSQRD